MPIKPNRFKKREGCPVNHTSATSKDARISLLTKSRLGSKLNVCDATLKRLKSKFIPVNKYVHCMTLCSGHLRLSSQGRRKSTDIKPKHHKHKDTAKTKTMYSVSVCPSPKPMLHFLHHVPIFISQNLGSSCCIFVYSFSSPQRPIILLRAPVSLQ